MRDDRDGLHGSHEQLCVREVARLTDHATRYFAGLMVTGIIQMICSKICGAMPIAKTIFPPQWRRKEEHMRFKNTVIGVATGISCLVGPAATAQDIEVRFGQFRVGDRCSIITAALGEPTATISSSTLGVAHARIRWVVGSRAYVAVCVVDRLVSKRTCHGSVPDC